MIAQCFRHSDVLGPFHSDTSHLYELFTWVIHTSSSYECLFTLMRANDANTRVQEITHVILMSLDVAYGRLLTLVLLQISWYFVDEVICYCIYGLWGTGTGLCNDILCWKWCFCAVHLNGDSGYTTLMWILDRTSGIREKISKFRHANYIYSPVIHTDVHLQHEWLQAFAWKIAVNIHVLVSVNTQAKILHVHSCK